MHIYIPSHRKVGLHWDFQHLSPEGDVLWEDYEVHNALSDAGEQSILSVYFRAGTAITTFFGRLYNASPSPSSDMTLSGEVTGTGYAPASQAAWARNSTDWPTLALDSGDYRVSGVQRTYTAGGNWTAANHLILASSSSGTSGTLVAYVPLSTTRTLSNGDSLNVTPRVKLSGGS